MDPCDVVEGVRDVAGVDVPAVFDCEVVLYRDAVFGREVVLYRDEEPAVLGRVRDADDVGRAACVVVRREDDAVRVVGLALGVPPDAVAVGSTADGSARVSSAPSPAAEKLIP